jgi:hypothetical protein
MPEFTLSPNAYGRVAGGQEGSGQAQIFQPYDAAKFDRQAVEIKKEQDKANKAIKPSFIEAEDLAKKFQDYYFEEGSAMYDEYQRIAQERQSLFVEQAELKNKYNDNIPQEELKDWNKRMSDNNYKLNMFEANAIQGEAVKKNTDGLIKAYDAASRTDSPYDPISADNIAKLEDMSIREQAKAQRTQRILIPQTKMDYITITEKQRNYVKSNLYPKLGWAGDPVLNADGVWVAKSGDGSEVPIAKVLPMLQEQFVNLAVSDREYGNFWINKAAYTKDEKSGLTWQQEAEAADVNTNNDVEYFDWMAKNKGAEHIIPDWLVERSSNQRISFRTPSEGAGDTYINVNANVAPSSIQADRALETGKVNAGLTVFGGGSYAISGASVLPKEDIEKLGGNVSFQATEADIGGTLKTNINIPIAAGTNIIVYQAAATKDEIPDAVLRSMGASKNRQLSDTQVDILLKQGGAKYLKFLPYAQITGTYEGSAATGRNTLNNVGSIVSQEKKNAYQTAATQMSKDFWSTLGNNYAKYPSMHNGGWRYAATLYQTYYNDGYTAEEIFQVLDGFVKQGYQLEQAYDEVNKYLSE